VGRRSLTKSAPLSADVLLLVESDIGAGRMRVQVPPPRHMTKGDAALDRVTLWRKKARTNVLEGFSSMTTTTCPICGSDAEELPRTGDFEGFDCPTHDKFEVANTAMSIRSGKASAEHWERSLERAKLRAGSGKRPRILDNDFL
jgi:hypothetical protein